MGNNPVFAPGLLDGPTAKFLIDHLYVAAPFSTFDEHPDLLKEYTAAYPNSTPSLGVLFGFGMSETMKEVLDTACENGDLTRAGVLEAFTSLSDVETGGLIVPIRGFEVGKSPSLQSYVLRPAADVEGGATVAKDAFEGDLAQSLDE